MAIAIHSVPSGSKKSDEPQVEQNPRRTFSVLNHVTLSVPRIVTAERGTSVDASKWPECFRH